MVYLQISVCLSNHSSTASSGSAVVLPVSAETWLLLLNPWFMVRFDLNSVFTSDINHLLETPFKF